MNTLKRMFAFIGALIMVASVGYGCNKADKKIDASKVPTVEQVLDEFGTNTKLDEEIAKSGSSRSVMYNFTDDFYPDNVQINSVIDAIVRLIHIKSKLPDLTKYSIPQPDLSTLSREEVYALWERIDSYMQYSDEELDALIQDALNNDSNYAAKQRSVEALRILGLLDWGATIALNKDGYKACTEYSGLALKAVIAQAVSNNNGGAPVSIDDIEFTIDLLPQGDKPKDALIIVVSTASGINERYYVTNQNSIFYKVADNARKAGELLEKSECGESDYQGMLRMIEDANMLTGRGAVISNGENIKSINDAQFVKSIIDGKRK